MRIAGIQSVVPSRTVTNDIIKSMIADHSSAALRDRLRSAINRVDFSLTYSGSDQRRWLADHESPFDLLEKAISEALSQASASAAEVELIIYTGVDRGFLEPAMAYLVGAAFGMRHADCFDIVDACMSWTRATFLVSNLLAGGQYKNALVINCECNMRRGGRLNPGCFRLNTVEDVEC